MSKYDELAKIIIQNVGGESNVIALTHCITRLRFHLKEESKANTEVLESTEGIVMVIKNAGQYQVVIGSKVREVFLAVKENGDFRKKEGILDGVTIPRNREELQETKRESNTRYSKNKYSKNKERIGSPVAGLVNPLSEVPDEVFSKEILGKGVGIIPSEGRIYAPCDGRITVFFETGHGIALETDSGIKILIHVGLDTVNLSGNHFTKKAKEGDYVLKGQLLLEFDKSAIEKEGYSLITPVIITNWEKYEEISCEIGKRVEKGDTIISL
ncbi:glucose PTS transporter subunit IIA [Lachnospiraceae bacterium OttesenSCG-928-D06]|nr:glucose PTS transporter subunit IIA [Lachnospiraceae bacterium OttesenSCG-928-D06]